MYLILIECLLLIMIVYFIFYILFYKMKSEGEAIMPYECGFDPMSLTRLAFSYRFFLISILFLIFDVEISLMLPIPFFMGNLMGIFIFFVFILVLVVGLLYEYYYGSLDWLDNFISKA